MMKIVLADTYKKYGYKMFECSLEELFQYKRDCSDVKKQINPAEKFNYVTFATIADAVHKINSRFIPTVHGDLPKIQWSLDQSRQLLIKEIEFYNYEDQHLYQSAVERAWAIGGHLDPRVQQFFYD